MQLKTPMLAFLLFAGALNAEEMHQYVIERTIPGASEMSASDLQEISRKSRDVLEQLGPSIKWQQSYVAEDKFYCVYTAPNKDIIEEHAARGGFPVDRISEVSSVIAPSTAD
jgi:hypothetical protein